MIDLLFERDGLPQFDLPEPLARAYGGSIGFESPRLITNFVASIDGIVGLPGSAESGGVISSKNEADRFVMGLLRACADVVLVGAGTFRKAGREPFTAEGIFPAYADAFAELRARRKLAPKPQLVIVTASGAIDAASMDHEDAIVATTHRGREALGKGGARAKEVIAFDGRSVPLKALVERLRAGGAGIILTEGGPGLYGELLRESLVDELFLTTAPRLFGRFDADRRKGLVDDTDVHGMQMTLLGVRRSDSFLLCRYGRG